MATTPTYINQRINNLQAQINDITTSGVPTTSNLADVLVNGNSAGANGIDMNANAITGASSVAIDNITGSNSATTLDGRDIITTEINGSLNDSVVVNPANIAVTQDDGLAGTSNSTSLFWGDIECVASINSGVDFSSLSLGNSINPLIGAYFNYAISGAIPQTYFPFKYGNSEIFRYDTNGIKTANNKTIVLTDGTTTNTINYLGYTTRNSVQNITHYLNFSDSSATGIGAIQKTGGISCNPASNTVTASAFVGSLTGNASSASTITLVSDNTSGTYYVPFSKLNAGTARVLYVDDTTGPLSYNPSTATLTTTNFAGTATNATNTAVTTSVLATPQYITFVGATTGNNGQRVNASLTYTASTNTVSAGTYDITAIPATVNVASRFGQVGLVKLQTLTGTILGSASPVDFNLTNAFNASYANYKIIFSPTTEVAFSAYPSYSLKAFLGTGAPPPTLASLSGYEITSSNPALVSPVWTASATIATTPLTFSVSAFTNKEVVFEVRNVGFANTANNLIEILCKSVWSNPGINGSSDRTITSTSTAGTTITGLTLQQGSIGVGNNMNWSAIVYGYNQL